MGNAGAPLETAPGDVGSYESSGEIGEELMLVVVGGHSRNIGKTSVMASIIRMTAGRKWAAVKITQYGHGKCAAGGDCECAGGDHLYAITEETAASPKDSGRYLEAGAARAFWLRTRQGDLGHALPALKKILAENANVICESNSLLAYFVPDIYIMVLDGRVEDMKDSARRHFDRANAYVMVSGGEGDWPWEGIPKRWVKDKACFVVSPPQYESHELGVWVDSLGSV